MGDSHTCTHGAFGAFAAGVGTTDLEVGILKGVMQLQGTRNDQGKHQRQAAGRRLRQGYHPEVIKTLTVKGATDCVIEFRGDVVKGMSMESRMTLCNMAIEAGGTSGICMPDETTVGYLWPFISSDYKDKSAALADFKKWWSDEGCKYVKVLDIDVSTMQPQVTYGYKPDEVKDISEMEGNTRRPDLYRVMHQRQDRGPSRCRCILERQADIATC